MFFPFSDYIRVNVPQTNSNNAILYTTPYDCMIYFVPRGSNMEDDSPVGIFVENYFIDTDGDGADLFIFRSEGTSSISQQITNYTSAIVPAGRNIRAFIQNSSDRLGGTFHVFRLPLPALI